MKQRTLYQLFLTLILFFESFSNQFLSASIEDYLKPANDKWCQCPIPHIDFMYVINLDQRPEKFAHCLQQLAPYSIIPYRFSAVNGWELTLDAINQLGIICNESTRSERVATYFSGKNLKRKDETMNTIGRTYFHHKMSLGAIGIVLSHMSILQDAYDSGYQIVWIIEDDIEVIQNPFVLGGKIDELNLLVGEGGWDILFTDKDTKDKQGNYVICLSHAWRPNFTPNDVHRFAQRELAGSSFIKLGARYGAYSYIINRQGMKKILEFIKQYKIFIPYDMDYTLPNDINLFSLIEDVVSTQPQAISDNEKPTYK